MAEPTQTYTTPTKEHKTGATGLQRLESYTEQSIPRTRFIFLSLGLCLGLFLAMLDTSIVATGLVTIGIEFSALSEVNWVALAYTLAFLGLAGFVARVSDVIGRRNGYLGSFAIFAIFSIACGFAQSLEQLIAFRALQAIGGAGLYSLTMVIFPEVTPDENKQHIASLVGVVLAVAGISGPVLGGLLTGYTTWRWLFWINGPLAAVSVLLCWFAWPSEAQLPAIEKRRWRDLDYLGSLLLIAAAVLVVFPFQNASSKGSWTSATFIAPLVAGVICWIALFGWQIFIERKWKDAIAAAVPASLLRNRVYVAALLNTMLLGFPYFHLIFAFTQRLQQVDGHSPLIAGLMLLPMLGGTAIGSALGGIINGATNWIFETMMVATASVALGTGLLSTLNEYAPGDGTVDAKALGFIVFVGLGFGMSASTSTMLAASEASIQDNAPAQGILAQIRIFGGSLGIAASSAILGAHYRSDLESVLSPEQIRRLEAGTSGLSPEQAAAVRHAHSSAFSEGMRVCAAIAAACLIATLPAWRAYSRRMTLAERRVVQVEEEVARRRAMRESKGSVKANATTSSTSDGEAV